jgi:hypothetical protein
MDASGVHSKSAAIWILKGVLTGLMHFFGVICKHKCYAMSITGITVCHHVSSYPVSLKPFPISEVTKLRPLLLKSTFFNF